MTLTVFANITSTPPRFEVTITSPDGSAITAATLSRTVNGVTTATRVQPTTGPSPRVVNDYEADWGVGVQYQATVTDSAGTQTFTSNYATLTPPIPWLIHPTTPALSMPLDQGIFSAMGVVEHGTVSRAADAATAHGILGAKYKLVTVSGPRSASVTSLTIATVTDDEESGLWALVDDLTPLLIRVPASWGWGWEDGYYQVGQIDDSRFVQYGPEQRRVFQLPLERVQAPTGTQQSEASWADLLANFSTWASVASTYASWTAVLTNTEN